MIINQRRVKSLARFGELSFGMTLRICKNGSDVEPELLQKIGFTAEFNIGETVLPSIVGAVTRRNAQGKIIVDKTQKEECTRMIEWTYKQYAGRDNTREVTDSTVIHYKRWRQTLIPPYAIELTVAEKNGIKQIVSPIIEYNEVNIEKIIHIINVFLEIFGECEITDINNNPIIVATPVRLNWELLPRGKFPWSVQKERVQSFINKARGRNQPVVEKRLEKVSQYCPDFTAIGVGGFSGYILYGFEAKEIYVLESTQVNNATYILNKNWEKISGLTKAEILNEHYHKARVIHNEHWYSNIGEILA